jgi:hypothetical protein
MRRQEGTWRQFGHSDSNLFSVADRFSHRVERDFVEWEALVMERRDLLDLIRELTAPVDAAS